MSEFISIELAKALRKLENSGDIESFRVYESYSGRFMFGETCCGIVMGSLADFVDVLEWLDDEKLEKEAKKLWRCRSTDSLGYDVIAYFEGYKWPTEV
jgi:hypothetical protein